jgi:thiosulfate/3-mercaptopyruvate sulfurtransferase
MPHSCYNLIFSHKIRKMTALNWSYEEFMCFVMIYASHSDMEFTEDEKSKIIASFGQDMFDRQYAEFNELNDFQALNKILDYKEKYFATEVQKNDLLTKIKAQFFVDGFSEFEKEIYHFLDKLFQ